MENEPRISVNKLAELLVSSNPMRRRRIVQDQKYPNDAIVARYRLVHAPIREFLMNGRKVEPIKAAISKLRNDKSGTEWAIDDRWNTADALERFLEISDLVPHEAGEEYQLVEQSAPKLTIAGVDISVQPHILVSFTRRGKKYQGAIKFHFIKNPDSALTRPASEYVAALLMRWLEDHGPDGVTPAHTHCLCIDVFRGTAVSAPRSTARRMAEVTAACQDLSWNWPHL